MEPQIRHVRFFNGQFLAQQEFNEEQTYANHMRRRLNYALFVDGVIEITAADLRIVREPPLIVGNRRIRVTNGMAMAGYSDLKEGKEIIRQDETEVFDLSTGFAGGTVWVTVNYRRSESMPVTLGASTQNSRVDETAQVRLHAARPAVGAVTAEGDPLIIIGSVTFATTDISYDDRQTARIRNALMAAEPGITLDPASVTAGTINFETTIRSVGGFNLSTLAATGIAFSSAAGISPIPVTIVSGPTASSVRIRFTVAAGAAVGPRNVIVTIPGQPPESAPLTINAFVPAPTVTGINRPSARRNQDLIITGTNFVGTTVVDFNNAPNVAHTVNSATEIFVPIVPLSAQPGNLIVTAQGGPSAAFVVNVQN